MDVRIDESGQQGRPVGVQHLDRLVGPQAPPHLGDPPVDGEYVVVLQVRGFLNVQDPRRADQQCRCHVSSRTPARVACQRRSGSIASCAKGTAADTESSE